MEILEVIKELIKLPFDILDAAIGDSKIGYALLMILFCTGLVTTIYYVLDFTTKIIRGIFVFLSESFDSFTSIFKSKKKPLSCEFQGFESNNKLLIDYVDEKFNEINKKLDGINRENRTKDIL